MHVITRHRDPKPKPFLDGITHHYQPSYRRLRGKRYNGKGECIGVTGRRHTIEPREVAALKAAEARARLLPPIPHDSGTTSYRNFRPLPGRVLVMRPPQITVENGVTLPESMWRHPQHFIVVAVGAGVTCCLPGESVIFQKNHRPKEAWMIRKFYLGRETGVAAVLDVPTISVEEVLNNL